MSLYKSGGRAVDVRASRIQTEYRAIANKVDQDLGLPDGQGPTTRKLSQYLPVLDLVFGAYGEVSEGVKLLLDTLVEARMKKLGLAKGAPVVGKETAWTKGISGRGSHQPPPKQMTPVS